MIRWMLGHSRSASGAKILTLIVLLLFLRTLTLPVHIRAQDAVVPTPSAENSASSTALNNAVTFDMVNAVAKKLYCPVCPNETLTDCQTQACAQWRDEIHTQLVAGQTEEQVIASFVQRYGDRVLAIPQDPTLNALSLVTPFVLAGLALIIGAVTFLRWRRRPAEAASLESPVSPDISGAPEEDYRARLERDLQG